MTKDERDLYYTWPAVRQLINQLEAESSQWGRTIGKLLESPAVEYAQVEIARMTITETNARLHELRQLLGYWEETHHSTRISLPIQVGLIAAAIYMAIMFFVVVYLLAVARG